MSLFKFGKKKEEEKKAPSCSCNCGCSAESLCCIKVLGAGCKSCHEQYESAKDAVKALMLYFGKLPDKNV